MSPRNPVMNLLGWMSTLAIVACTSQGGPTSISLAAAPVEAKVPEPVAAAPVDVAEPVAVEAAAPAPSHDAQAAKGEAAQVRLQGIDVSHYQPSVKWESLKHTTAFVFVKATESTSKVDPRFAAHWSGAREAGLPRGAYHFFHPQEDVDQQVANFIKHLKPDPGELPPVVDVEQFRDEYSGFTCAQLAERLQRFSQGVEKELGRKPMIYTNHVTWSTSFCDHPYFIDHPLWLAAYVKQAEPKLPKGWKRWHFWQYTDSGKVAGIDGQVDQSYFNGTLEELKTVFAVDVD